MKKLLLMFLFTVLLSSCAAQYDPAPQILPDYIKNIYIRPILNNTNQFGLEAKFMNAVVDEFLSDGRLSLVNTESEANGALSVTIKKYILQPLTYDVNMVAEQYKLWIIVSVSFIDIENNVTLWTEPNMEAIQIYRDITRSSQNSYGLGEGMSEEEARAIIWEKLSRDIVKRTIKGFGSVTSVSERKVPS
ncbi:LPS assembly lipoprotein LptE [Endomicrobium proavitum]|uniref:Putative lipoprotein n=1 Tax=Endomicrobium proavitum TaxID=1408281 RepID=A0A0G3WH00_9BACT|nr:LPS assembly lipoprotein LptE [Endomicrobium proavitum]AKL97598.1 putative lipoprotein [Endomicrobium proavitum]